MTSPNTTSCFNFQRIKSCAKKQVKPKVQRGEDNINAKITNEQAFQIVKLIEDGKTTTEIIKELNIGRSIINDIRFRKSRKYLNFKKATQNLSNKHFRW